MIWSKLSNSTENDYLDFKMKWYDGATSELDMLHDILCLSNSLTDSTSRYIIIGVKEHKVTKEKSFYDVVYDNNHRTSEDIIQVLRNYMSVIPDIEVLRENISDCSIDIIKITPQARNLPYVLNQNIECKYKDKHQKEKNKKLIKNAVYSRDTSRNTPKNELCTKATLEELFARKKGEHLPILERFGLYLDDIENWKRPKRYDNEEISEDAYYYMKNHKFKLIRQKGIYDSLVKLDKADNYAHLVTDTALCEDYWVYRDRPNHSCYDDMCSWFNMELWADNTLIEVFNILELYIKYYFSDKGISNKQTFYLPSIEDMKYIYECKTKNDIQKSLVWKICKLIYRCDLPPDIFFVEEDSSIILDYLNYDYLINLGSYIEKNKNWIYAEPHKV